MRSQRAHNSQVENHCVQPDQDPRTPEPQNPTLQRGSLQRVIFSLIVNLSLRFLSEISNSVFEFSHLRTGKRFDRETTKATKNISEFLFTWQHRDLCSFMGQSLIKLHAGQGGPREMWAQLLSFESLNRIGKFTSYSENYLERGNVFCLWPNRQVPRSTSSSHPCSCTRCQDCMQWLLPPCHLSRV